MAPYKADVTIVTNFFVAHLADNRCPGVGSVVGDNSAVGRECDLTQVHVVYLITIHVFEYAPKRVSS